MQQNQFSIPYSTLFFVRRDIPAEVYYPFHPISRREISTTAPLYVSGTLITTTTTRCQNSQKTPSSITSTAPGNSNSWSEQEQEEQGRRKKLRKT
jgi:hypothetical protein